MLDEKNIRMAFIIFLFVMMITVACTGSGGTEPTVADGNDVSEERDPEEGDMAEMDHEHDDNTDGRIPNPGGAAIRILSPADGDEFPAGDQIIVEVEVENFTLGEEGNHWHAYVDGESFGMVVGGNTDHPLTGVEPGEHDISVYLANGSHEEFIEGDTIHVVVK